MAQEGAHTPRGRPQTTRKREKRQHAATWPQNRPTLATLRPGIQPKGTQGRPGHPQGQGRALHRADIELQDLPAADPRIFGRMRAKTRPTDALCWTFSPPDDHQHPGNGTPARPPPASRRPWTARIHATATAAELRDAAAQVRGSSPGRPGSGNRHPRKRDSGYSRRDRLQRELSAHGQLSFRAPPLRSAAVNSIDRCATSRDRRPKQRAIARRARARGATRLRPSSAGRLARMGKTLPEVESEASRKRPHKPRAIAPDARRGTYRPAHRVWIPANEQAPRETYRQPPSRKARSRHHQQTDPVQPLPTKAARLSSQGSLEVHSHPPGPEPADDAGTVPSQVASRV